MKPYVKPELRRLGSVRELTLAPGASMPVKRPTSELEELERERRRRRRS